MFHRAKSLKLMEGTALEVSFEDGAVRRYDMRRLFGKYPQLRQLENRALFLSAKLYPYGIIWNDELDIEAETIWADGEDCAEMDEAARIPEYERGKEETA